MSTVISQGYYTESYQVISILTSLDTISICNLTIINLVQKMYLPQAYSQKM